MIHRVLSLLSKTTFYTLWNKPSYRHLITRFIISDDDVWDTPVVQGLYIQGLRSLWWDRGLFYRFPTRRLIILTSLSINTFVNVVWLHEMDCEILLLPSDFLLNRPFWSDYLPTVSFERTPSRDVRLYWSSRGLLPSHTQTPLIICFYPFVPIPRHSVSVMSIGPPELTELGKRCPRCKIKDLNWT